LFVLLFVCLTVCLVCLFVCLFCLFVLSAWMDMSRVAFQQYAQRAQERRRHESYPRVQNKPQNCNELHTPCAPQQTNADTQTTRTMQRNA
jgi:hypothetical protein